MDALRQSPGISRALGWAAAVVLIAGCASVQEMGPGRNNVTLSGNQEVPPTTTTANGSGVITVATDKSVRGSVITTGVDGTAAHIHMGAPGNNGPVIIPLTKIGDSTWQVPAGATLTDEQYQSFKAGELYVNVHSAKYKGGEIRGQLKP